MVSEDRGLAAHYALAMEAVAKSMQSSQRVMILPVTKHAKDRINQHGKFMELMREEGDKVLVRSFMPTDRGDTHWMGWFPKTEVEYVDG